MLYNNTNNTTTQLPTIKKQVDTHIKQVKSELKLVPLLATIISEPCGKGKTEFMIQEILDFLLSGIQPISAPSPTYFSEHLVIYALPANTVGSEIGIRFLTELESRSANGADTSQIVVKTINGDVSDDVIEQIKKITEQNQEINNSKIKSVYANSKKYILIITHTAYLELSNAENRHNLNNVKCYIDELLPAIQSKRTYFTGKKLITDFFFHKDDQLFLTEQGLEYFNDPMLKMDIHSLGVSLREQILLTGDDRYSSWCTKEAWDAFFAAETETPFITCTNIINEKFITPYATYAAANLDLSFFYKISKKLGVTFTRQKIKGRANKGYESNKIQIKWLMERNNSMTFKRDHKDIYNAMRVTIATDIKQHDGKGIVIENGSQYEWKNMPSFCKKVQQNIAGSCGYKEYHDVVCLSAINLGNDSEAIASLYGMDETEMFIAYCIDTYHQVIMRSAVREDTDEMVYVYVVDYRSAVALKELHFNNATISKLGNFSFKNYDPSADRKEEADKIAKGDTNKASAIKKMAKDKNYYGQFGFDGAKIAHMTTEQMMKHPIWNMVSSRGKMKNEKLIKGIK